MFQTEVALISIVAFIALVFSATSAYVLFKWVRPLVKKATPVIDKAGSFLETDSTSQLKKIIENDAQHMIEATMDKAFVEYAPKLQRAVMIGGEQMLRPIVQESMDALGTGISKAVGGVVQEILRHKGAQNFGELGGLKKVANAQVREGKKALILAAVNAKAGPMVAGAVSNMGLDDEFLELQESNPELAGMIISKLTGGEGQASPPPDTRTTTKKPGGWYS